MGGWHLYCCFVQLPYSHRHAATVIIRRNEVLTLIFVTFIQEQLVVAQLQYVKFVGPQRLLSERRLFLTLACQKSSGAKNSKITMKTEEFQNVQYLEQGIALLEDWGRGFIHPFCSFGSRCICGVSLSQKVTKGF